VDALDIREPRHALRMNPVEEFDGGARIGAARVRVADVGGEEFEEAIGGVFPGCDDEGRARSVMAGTSWFMSSPTRTI
jgi:hypothetical protein